MTRECLIDLSINLCPLSYSVKIFSLYAIRLSRASKSVKKCTRDYERRCEETNSLENSQKLQSREKETLRPKKNEKWRIDLDEILEHALIFD